MFWASKLLVLVLIERKNEIDGKAGFLFNSSSIPSGSIPSQYCSYGMFVLDKELAISRVCSICNLTYPPTRLNYVYYGKDICSKCYHEVALTKSCPYCHEMFHSQSLPSHIPKCSKSSSSSSSS